MITKTTHIRSMPDYIYGSQKIHELNFCENNQ